MRAESSSAWPKGRASRSCPTRGRRGISDPGARTVRAVRAAGFPVIPIPGPSAVATASSAAGLLADAFLFAGFLPAQAKARRARLQALAQVPAALVFYEAPHRIRATADDLRAALGEARTLVVAREFTKTFETISVHAAGRRVGVVRRRSRIANAANSC